ncbi:MULTISPECIES: hypothetical protein [Streptomyces]|uniref:SUKH-3 immunity protein of toxin-antitoxin system n=1 Tax=Streptomyces poriferorum TaxID=2798799 RepID=A0ABY9IH46_9ACTN|nr:MULTISPECIES: hypothetical protein [unclassified Streptomyces]MDP5315607.1 hypothetical protein [Streptomyces sp. Alt4]WLQ53981.1 hypothetical protein P8A19_00230 [Streptomyces sp. Alt2]WSI60631.1 hypothetical protein OG471_00275 [Streptomyces sp. NBC_01336]
MSRSRDIEITFARTQAVSDLVAALERGGWAFGEGKIRYLVDPDFFDWDEVGVSERSKAMRELEAASAQLGCGFQMAWGDEGQEASFLLLDSGRLLSVSPFAELAFRGDTGMFLDHEWYLSRVMPVLFDRGVNGFSCRDLQD